MAVTTTNRLGLYLWGDGGDPFTRNQMTLSHSNLELKAAGFSQAGTKPAASADYEGFFHWDGATLSYCDGTDWYDVRKYGSTVNIDGTPSSGSDDATARADHKHGIDDSTITTAMIQDSSITTDKMNDLSVTTAKIGSGAVTNAKLGNDIDANKLATGTIPEARIANGAITAAKLGGSSVQEAKIATGAVTTAKIANGNVTADKLDDLAVTTAKLDDLAVTGDKIANATITTDKINQEFINSLPKGVVLFTEKTTSTGLGNWTLITGGTFQAEAGRLYRASTSGSFDGGWPSVEFDTGSSNESGQYRLSIYVNGTASRTNGTQFYAKSHADSLNVIQAFTASGPTTVQVRGWVNRGGSVYPLQLIVEDIGPIP